jgi:hypothetical protein
MRPGLRRPIRTATAINEKYDFHPTVKKSRATVYVADFESQERFSTLQAPERTHG